MYTAYSKSSLLLSDDADRELHEQCSLYIVPATWQVKEYVFGNHTGA